MNDYVKRLRPWRLEHKISVRKMAKMLGLSASYYWMLETGVPGAVQGHGVGFAHAHRGGDRE